MLTRLLLGRQLGQRLWGPRWSLHRFLGAEFFIDQLRSLTSVWLLTIPNIPQRNKEQHFCEALFRDRDTWWDGFPYLSRRPRSVPSFPAHGLRCRPSGWNTMASGHRRLWCRKRLSVRQRQMGRRRPGHSQYCNLTYTVKKAVYILCPIILDPLPACCSRAGSGWGSRASGTNGGKLEF